MRVAVTGAGGRLGSALVVALEDAPFTGPFGPLAWDRSAFDLDRPDDVGRRLDLDRPEVVVHTAAWTDVDGCAREPDLALARNGLATGVLAGACAERGVDLLVISTNEVFDGARTDGIGYGPDDRTEPGNAYGRSKLHGERAARIAFEGAGAALGIARTSWLFGPPGPDFPWKILDVAERVARDGGHVRLVEDEWGTPTYAPDLAEAIVELLAEDALAGVHHLVNGGMASRATWAEEVLARAGLTVPIERITGAAWERPSTAPRWGVLAPTPLPSGEPMRPWPAAMADYMPTLTRARAGVR